MTRFLFATFLMTTLVSLLMATVSPQLAVSQEPPVPLPYSVTVSGPQTVLPGDTAVYTFRVTNGSPIPLDSLILQVQWYRVQFESDNENHIVIGEAVGEQNTFASFVMGSKDAIPDEDGSVQWSVPILQPQETKGYLLQCRITKDFPSFLALIATVRLDSPDAKFANFAIIVQRNTDATTPTATPQTEKGSAKNIPFEQSLVENTLEVNTSPMVDTTLAAIAKIPTPERRILAALKLASLETELFGLAAAEKTFDMILSTVKEVKSFEIRMEIICAVADIYRAAAETEAIRNGKSSGTE